MILFGLCCLFHVGCAGSEHYATSWECEGATGRKALRIPIRIERTTDFWSRDFREQTTWGWIPTDEPLDPVGPDQARIRFIRNSSMFGSTAQQTLVDRGNGVAFDSYIEQRYTPKPSEANFDRSSNVTCIEAPSKRDPKVLNARLCGYVRSGGMWHWTRPPGEVRIEVITSGGDQAFSPAFKVEGGHTYEVEYEYMTASFKIRPVDK